MKLLPQGISRYAILLIVLFAIAAFGAHTTIFFLQEQFPSDGERLRGVIVAIWALTMGFMFLSGALGLWGIRTTTEIESRRLIGNLVESMDFLSDGLIAVSGQNIEGANPAAKVLIGDAAAASTRLKDCFPILDDTDVHMLTVASVPKETAKDIVLDDHTTRIYRFRSQHGGGMRLILISDVTEVRAQEERARQTVQLQLIGRITEGAAHDFNNILCVIAGHISLLNRQPVADEHVRESLAAIRSQTQRGAELAGQLLELSRSGVAGKPTDRLGHHVDVAANLLRVGLSEQWKVETRIEDGFPVVSMTGNQIEQAIVKLGVLAADQLTRPGVLSISAARPENSQIIKLSKSYAAVITVSAALGAEQETAENNEAQVPLSVDPEDERTGAIFSVVRSVISQAGGRVDTLTGPNHLVIYHIALPFGRAETQSPDVAMLPAELRSYIAHWRVLLAAEPSRRAKLADCLKEIGTDLIEVDNALSAIACIEKNTSLHAVVFDYALLGDEADSLLRTITKLAPASGLVALVDDPDQAPEVPTSNLIYAAGDADPVSTMGTMFDARGLANRRLNERGNDTANVVAG